VRNEFVYITRYSQQFKYQYMNLKYKLKHKYFYILLFYVLKLFDGSRNNPVFRNKFESIYMYIIFKSIELYLRGTNIERYYIS